MKALISFIIAIVLILAFCVPAAAIDVTTGVSITQGGGSIPVIKCKWETPDDGDPTHIIPGTQTLPPVAYDTFAQVTVFVVVADKEDKGNVAQVVADIFHPAGPPENGSMKYGNIALVKMANSAGKAAFAEGVLQDLIQYNAGYGFDDVNTELIQGNAAVWSATFDIHYHQPAGMYTVTVTAVDNSNNVSEAFSNVFEYVAVCGIETDFTSIQYSSTMTGNNGYCDGDEDFTTSNMPTIRNIGNTYAFIDVWQDDMGFGKYNDGKWKVLYDARLGPQADDADSTNVVYSPEALTRLPNVLELCHTMKMDFSIHVLFAGPGTYGGIMKITCAIAPF